MSNVRKPAGITALISCHTLFRKSLRSEFVFDVAKLENEQAHSVAATSRIRITTWNLEWIRPRSIAFWRSPTFCGWRDRLENSCRKNFPNSEQRNPVPGTLPRQLSSTCSRQITDGQLLGGSACVWHDHCITMPHAVRDRLRRPYPYICTHVSLLSSWLRLSRRLYSLRNKRGRLLMSWSQKTSKPRAGPTLCTRFSRSSSRAKCS